jgi:hypothetical protein
VDSLRRSQPSGHPPDHFFDHRDPRDIDFDDTHHINPGTGTGGAGGYRRQGSVADGGGGGLSLTRSASLASSAPPLVHRSHSLSSHFEGGGQREGRGSEEREGGGGGLEREGEEWPGGEGVEVELEELGSEGEEEFDEDGLPIVDIDLRYY